jgi:hypothetical protein
MNHSELDVSERARTVMQYPLSEEEQLSKMEVPMFSCGPKWKSMLP